MEAVVVDHIDVFLVIFFVVSCFVVNRRVESAMPQ